MFIPEKAALMAGSLVVVASLLLTGLVSAI